MHLPPPVHGAAMVGKQIVESNLIRESFDCTYINASTSVSLDDVGRFAIGKIKRACTFFMQVIRAVRDEQPDLVYFTPSTSGWAFYRDLITICLLRHKGQKVVLHFHNKPTDAFLNKWYNQGLWKRFFNGVSAIFLGEVLARQFDKFTPLCKEVYICPNGIPDKLVSKSTESSRHVANKPFSFLFLSNMIETKGVYVLLDACAKLKQEGYSFSCNFVGQWFDVTKEAFEAKCAQLDIADCVQAFGAKYGAEKETFLRQADAFVFPTYYAAECFPLVLLEAMQYSLPIISTCEGAISNIVTNAESGWIVDKRNSEAVAEKMKNLIDHFAEAERMGIDGRRRFEDFFSLEHFETRMKEILSNCIVQK